MNSARQKAFKFSFLRLYGFEFTMFDKCDKTHLLVDKLYSPFRVSDSGNGNEENEANCCGS